MRCAFTIVLNGLRHLEHNNFFKRMEKMLDRWVIVEGAAKNTGSTHWCRKVDSKYCTHEGLSTDGTTEFLREHAPGDTPVHHLEYGGYNKDEMVNRAIEELDEFVLEKSKYYLWQIDVDEQWTEEQMSKAEMMLEYMGGTCGKFLCDYYVGPNLLAKGDWGEGRQTNYRRLWKWRGQRFKTHEPPELEGGNGLEVLLPQRFKHYAYYFPEDVQFKEAFYSGHEGAYLRWAALQDATEFPVSVDRLITGPWGRTKTVIVREDDSQ